MRFNVDLLRLQCRIDRQLSIADYKQIQFAEHEKEFLNSGYVF